MLDEFKVHRQRIFYQRRTSQPERDDCGHKLPLRALPFELELREPRAPTQFSSYKPKRLFAAAFGQETRRGRARYESLLTHIRLAGKGGGRRGEAGAQVKVLVSLTVAAAVVKPLTTIYNNLRQICIACRSV